MARVITDVKVEQSPWWLQKRLMYAGMRPINNIVDITNFVMLEYGQPLHAFDINQVKGGKIIVENAKDGEVFTTLDGTERTLTDDMLLIKDAERGMLSQALWADLTLRSKKIPRRSSWNLQTLQEAASAQRLKTGTAYRSICQI